MENDTSASGERGVSLIITCFNQGAFLAEAIESALRQTIAFDEIVLIDDGSTDDTQKIAGRYEGIRYVHQGNQGLAAARNHGIARTTGDYLMFLDADDRLFPSAVEHNLKCVRARPECGFVYGKSILIGPEGSFLRHPQRLSLDGDAYAALLRRNVIGMHGTVMYRRSILESVGGFDPSLPACEDYDLYLRIVRRHAIHAHDAPVAEYRRHGAAMSTDAARMLRSVLRVLRSQRAHLGGTGHRDAYEAGMRSWKEFYGRKLFFSALRALSKGRLLSSLGSTYGLLRHAGLPTTIRNAPVWASQLLSRYRRTTSPILAALAGRPVGRLRFGDLRRTEAIGNHVLYRRRTSISDYYVDRFLSQHSGNIGGRVLGIGDYALTGKLHGEEVIRSKELKQEGPSGKLRFDRWVHELQGESERFDSIVVLQRLNRIYDLSGAVAALRRMLRDGGVLLATVPGVSAFEPETNGAETLWRFTPLSAQRLFASTFPDARAEPYGNVLAAIAQVHGLEASELSAKELNYGDPMHPLLVGITAEDSSRGQDR